MENVEVVLESELLLEELINEAAKEDTNINIHCHDIAKDIQKRNTELVKLVEKLGPLLTDKNPELRKRGTDILAEILQNLPQDFLHGSELQFVTTFFCDRLKDHNVVIPAVLQGILSVADMCNFPGDASVQILTTMFQHIHCQTLKQTERNTVYKILKSFLQNAKEELKRLGPDFIFGVISTIDGERDPRNLLLLFGMLPDFLRTFPLGHLTEEMFEVMACYFPIDFYSVPHDPDAVSRDELAHALMPCLVAVPAFAEFCIPLLLEKLDSQLHIAKLDSLQMLQACCKTFTLEGVEKHLHDLCRSLHREILPGTDKEVCKEALVALKELIHMLSVVPVDRNQSQLLHNTVENIINDGIHALQDVQLSLFLPSARMLLTVAQASPAACQMVINEVVPLLMNQYYNRSNIEGKIILLQTLTSFLAVCEDSHVTPMFIPELTSIWADVSCLYMSAAQHNRMEVRKEGLHGFLISARSLCSDTRSKVYEIMCICVKQEDSPPVRQEVILCLKRFASLYPHEVMEVIVLSKLHWNQQEQESGDAHNSLLHSHCMEALCEIAIAEPFTSCIVPQILSFITDVFHTDRCNMGIKCLRKLVESPEAGSEMHKYLFVKCWAISQLVSWWLRGICEGSQPQIFESEGLLLDTAKIVSTILRTQEKSAQHDVVVKFIPHFLDGNSPPEESNFRPLDPLSPWQHTQSVVLLEALLCPLQQDVNIPSLSGLVMKLLMLALHTSHALTSKCASRLVACLVNKAPDSEHLCVLLSDLLMTLKTTLTQNDVSTEVALNAVNMFSWLTKALLMRGYRETDSWIDMLVEMLSHNTIGSMAAEGFKLIMVHNDDYMDTDNYCNVKVLYRQRFFQTVPKLVEHYHKAVDHPRCNILVALAYLLQGVPKVVLHMSLLELVPLLVESLGQKEVILLMSTLETLHDLLESKEPVLEEHLQTFLPKFLQLAQFKFSMRVRIISLQCVLQTCNYPTHILLPYKQQVIHELGSCLDDPKRLVRKQAVITRTQWFLVGSPGEPTRS